MNPFWEKNYSLTSRTHSAVPSKGEATVVALSIIRHRQGILESTRIDFGYEVMDTRRKPCRKPNAREESCPICLRKHFKKEKAHGRESAVEKLSCGRISSTRTISGRPPRSPRKMRQVLSSVSVKESHKDPGASKAHQRRSSTFKRFQQSDSKWNSGSGTLTDRPPLQPLRRHGISESKCAITKEYHKDPRVEKIRRGSSIRSKQQCGSRWSSGYRARFDMAPSQAHARGRMIVKPSGVSAANESLNDGVQMMKNRPTLFDTRLRSSVFRFARSDRESLSPRYERLANRYQ
jgi:hypothetical protein